MKRARAGLAPMVRGRRGPWPCQGGLCQPGGAAVGFAPPTPTLLGGRQEGKVPGGDQSAGIRWSSANLCRRARAARPASHRAARICRTATGSSTVAITRSRPPQRAHANTSIANARRMRPAHVSCAAGAAPGPGAARAVGDGARRHDLRCRPAIAHDPRAPARMRREHAVVEEQVDLGPGGERGQLRKELEGLEHQVGRPIAPGRFNLTATCPSARRRRRSCASGGRSRYRQRCSSRARSLGGTRTLACRSKPVQVSLARPVARPASSGGSSPRRPTRAPACRPSATRPWTEALMIWARMGEISASRSGGPGSASPDSSPGAPAGAARGAGSRASTSATSSSLGGVAAWNSSAPGCAR